MKSTRCLTILSLTGLSLTISGLTAQVILDFETYFDTVSNTVESFNRGDVLTDQYASVGVTFSGQKYNGGSLVDSEIWIFDTTQPTTGGSGNNDGDPDLATPGYHPSNVKPLGNIVVVQEDTGSGKIPDDNVRGGVMTMAFSQPTFLHNAEILDIEKAGKTNLIGLDSNMNELFNISSFDNYGDNSYNDVLFNQNIAVNYLIFDHRGSGALGSLTLSPVPEPATIAFLSMGGLGVLLIGRRRILARRKAKQAASLL